MANKRENSKNLAKRMFLSISMMSFFVSAGVENVNAVKPDSIFGEAHKRKSDNSQQNTAPISAPMATTLAAKQDNSGYRIAAPTPPISDQQTNTRVGGNSLIIKDLNWGNVLSAHYLDDVFMHACNYIISIKDSKDVVSFIRKDVKSTKIEDCTYGIKVIALVSSLKLRDDSCKLKMSDFFNENIFLKYNKGYLRNEFLSFFDKLQSKKMYSLSQMFTCQMLKYNLISKMEFFDCLKGADVKFDIYEELCS